MKVFQLLCPGHPGNLNSVPGLFTKGCRRADLKEVGLASQKKKKKKSHAKSRRAALRHSLRPRRCGNLKPGNMVASCFLRRGLTALAGLLLFSFGSLAASQIEVGVRPSERQSPGRSALSWLRFPAAKGNIRVLLRLTGLCVGRVSPGMG